MKFDIENTVAISIPELLIEGLNHGPWDMPYK